MPKKRKRKPAYKGNKTTVDGIKFQSGLEKYCYLQLKKEKLFEHYEQERFELVQGFKNDTKVYAHQANGKGDYCERGSKKVLGISYTPDFTGVDYIIECKGRPNESFPLRWKLFRKHLDEINDGRILYMPKNQKDVDTTIQLIKEHRNENTKRSGRILRKQKRKKPEKVGDEFNLR